MQYAGRSFTLHSGEKQEVNQACGNHLLNGFGQRGLTSLAYGDDEAKIGQEAIDRNIRFKKRMLGEYNQRNEQRKMMGLGYLTPTSKLREYAVELAIKLIEPYTMKDAETEAISKATEENRQLRIENEAFRKDMLEMKTMMAELMKGRQETKEEPEGEIEIPFEAKEYKCDERDQSFSHHLALSGHKRPHKKEKR